jgi:DNA-binding NarL/FixJ family response regulator
VRRVLAGESPLDEKVAMGLLMSLMNKGSHEEEDRKGDPLRSTSLLKRSFGSGGARPTESLTPREVEILRLVVQGQTNQHVARYLLMSVSTVKRHLRHIGTKLGVCDRVQATVLAVKLGLLDERKGD